MPSPIGRSTGRLPPGRHGLPRHFVVHSQRERLLQAVAEAVSAHGYASTTIGHIVQAAEVSRRTFYEHFTDKEAALLASYDAAVEQLVNVLIDAFEQPDAWRDRVRAAMDAFLAALTAEPAFTRLAFVEVPAATAASRARHRATVRTFLRSLEQSRPPTPQSPPEITLPVLGAGIHEMVQTVVTDGRLADLPKLRPQLMYLLVLPYYGPQEAQREMDELRSWSLYDLSRPGRPPAD